MILVVCLGGRAGALLCFAFLVGVWHGVSGPVATRLGHLSTCETYASVSSDLASRGASAFSSCHVKLKAASISLSAGGSNKSVNSVPTRDTK